MALTIVHFSASGGGKSTQMREYFKYEFERTHGKLGRYITAEDDSQLQPVVNAGIVERFNLRVVPMKHRFSTLRRLSAGGWPRRLEQFPRDAAEFKDYWLPATPETWKTVGYYGIEGATSISDWLMEEARTEKYCVGEGAAGGTFQQEGETFSNQSRSQYLLVQKEMQARIINLAGLPVDRLMLTAHEVVGEEDITRSAVAGAALAGKGGSGKFPSWVGDFLHTDLYLTPSAAVAGQPVVMQTVRRTFFQPHPDEKLGNVVYNCKSRCPIEKIPQLMARWPKGHLTPTVDKSGQMVDSISDYLKLADRLVEEASGGDTAWRAAQEKKWAEEVAK